jgi:hypothetical protein
MFTHRAVPALPKRQTLFVTLYLIMPIVRRAILQISFSVGGRLGDIWLMVEVGRERQTLTLLVTLTTQWHSPKIRPCQRGPTVQGVVSDNKVGLQGVVSDNKPNPFMTSMAPTGT